MEQLPEVTILMATFNGAEFIKEQIESIRQQEYSSWRLLIRDDGSADDTPAIINELAAAEPRIEILADTLGNLGITGNFGELLRHAMARNVHYVAFADQDDVWQTRKLATQMKCMLEREKAGGLRIPVLVHTDLAVVDRELHLLKRSFMDCQGFRTGMTDPLRVLLVQNHVTGCTVLINRPLLEFAMPLPSCAPVHDWWLALCAAVSGELVFLPGSMVSYRQHGGNEVGVKGFISRSSVFSENWGYIWRGVKERFEHGCRQAVCLGERIREHADRCPIDKGAGNLVESYVQMLRTGSGLARLARVLKLGVRRQSLFASLIFLILVFSMKPLPASPRFAVRGTEGADDISR